MKRKPLVNIFVLAVLIWMTVPFSAFGQEVEIQPTDTFYIYVPAHDSLQVDSITNTVHRLLNRSQSNSDYEVEIPEFQYKSPEAFAFKRAGDYPVSEYTGSANISVPLYTMSYKDVGIPITLTYDASGVRVDQEASWVGLGWNLMAGGCINRVVSGQVDPLILNASQETWNDFLTRDTNEFYQT